MDYNYSIARMTPHNWIIQSNDGTNLVAYNPVIGETFSGTTANFNLIFANTLPTTSVGGALKVVEGFNLPEYDSISLAYTNDDLTSVLYYKDGAEVAAISLSYAAGKLSSVSRLT